MEVRIQIPRGIEVEQEGRVLRVKGPKGEVEREFKFFGVGMEVKGEEIIFSAAKGRKKERRILHTYRAHVRNMFKGVTKGFVYKLKICYRHFPIKVRVEGNEVLIENFLGERVPRKAKILPGAKVKVEGDEIIVEGIEKEKVAQTAANIERATRIKEKDRRVFTDGIFIYQKDEKVLVK